MGSDQLLKVVLTPFILLLASSAAAAYDANEVALGASEKRIKERFPYANCRALEWPTRAADWRCDDSRISFGGVDASVTFYLKRDAVEGFDVRFDRRELERVLEFLRKRYGAPVAEGPPPVKAEWKNKAERAVLTAEQGRRRASLLVSRGTFEEELYKVR
ncbi:MAG TPA: hypothetical protein VGJ74_01145 [Burkholderiales bacterium]|jgi:hypothetical protein